MADLHRVPTDDLVNELVKRSKGEWNEKPSDALPYCDPCEHFVPFASDPNTMPPNFNPCQLGHEMRFRTPVTMGDVHALYWGFYMHNCKDRRTPSDAQGTKE